MNQEKFISTYIDLLNTTLTEAIQKNLTTLAHKNVLEIELNEIKSSVNNSSETMKKNLDEKEKAIVELKAQLNDARKQKEIAANETNELKKNVQHIDTFKNELVKTRSELEKLNKEFNDLNREYVELKKQNESLKQELTELEAKKKERTVKSAFTSPDNKPVKKPIEKIKQIPEIQNETLLVKDAGNF